MTDTPRLFEKDKNGLLNEVPPAKAAARRAGGLYSHVNMIVDVLWTDAEIAARKAEEAAWAAQLKANADRDAAQAKTKQEAMGKLAKLGLTVEHLQALLGPGKVGE